LDLEIKPQNKSNQSNKEYSISEIRQTHPRAYDYWTKEEELRLIKRYQEGASISQLAKDFQRKSGGIKSRLKKLGLLE
jgi:hypothetical protein